MYKRFYGLTRAPFELSPDPERVFMSWTHKEGLAALEYGVVGKKGFVVLTGEVGTGKTTLLQSLVRSLEGNVHTCFLRNPVLSRDDFFSYLANAYDLNWEGHKALFLIEMEKFFYECGQKKERVLLIIDEAQVIPLAQMEEIRLLSNLDSTGGEVFSIFLVGQPELDAHLKDERLLPLLQRVGIRFHLERFTRDITIQYIIFRLRMAGAKHLDIFTEDALTLIHTVSRGTPRLINIICDNALLTGFADDQPIIDVDVIRECLDELQMSDGIETVGKGAKKSKKKRKIFRTGFIRSLARKKEIFLTLVFGSIIFILFLLVIMFWTRFFSPVGEVLRGWLLPLYNLFGRIGG